MWGTVPRDPHPGERDAQTRAELRRWWHLVSHVPSLSAGGSGEGGLSPARPVCPSLLSSWRRDLGGFRRLPAFPNCSFAEFLWSWNPISRQRCLVIKRKKDSFMMEGKSTVVSAACGVPLTHAV